MRFKSRPGFIYFRFFEKLARFFFYFSESIVLDARAKKNCSQGRDQSRPRNKSELKSTFTKGLYKRYHNSATIQGRQLLSSFSIMSLLLFIARIFNVIYVKKIFFSGLLFKRRFLERIIFSYFLKRIY